MLGRGLNFSGTSLVNMAKTMRVPKTVGNFLTNWGVILSEMQDTFAMGPDEIQSLSVMILIFTNVTIII